jgi:hypothetical protein
MLLRSRQMRRLLVATMAASLALSACACPQKAASGPAWPAPSTTADDGGESLEPRHTSVATALEKSAEPEPELEAAPAAADATKSADPAAAEGDKLPTMTAPTTPSDEVIFSEEMIIEIEE